MFGLFACAGGEARPWIPLDAAVSEVLLDEERWARELGCGVRLEPGDGGLWLEWELVRDAWSSGPGGIHSCERPLAPSLSKAPGSVLQLEAGGEPFVQRLVAKSAFGIEGELEPLEPGSFDVEGERLVWRLPEGSDSVGSVAFRELVPRGRLVAFERVSGRGLHVWPGERRSVTTPLRAGSALRFFCAARGGREGSAPVRFTVRLDGQELWRLERPLGADHDRWVCIPLGEGARSAARLELEVEGPPALTAFVDPVVGPLRPAHSGARPDVVVFLADTFRADNLEVYGGDPALTPSLNALARESLVFERAWGTSPWTLPSQASLFTGLYPPEHSATRREYVLSEDFTTLAEVLGQSGYRTAAVTDGAYLSRRFHMNQGFDWFLEHDPSRWDLDVTLGRARELLESHDGRPLFLFVHTYRAHTPYRVGPEESAEEYLAFLKTIYQRLKSEGAVPEEDRRALAREFRWFYERGLADLDAGFGAWWDEVRRLYEARPCYLVFTSDHGEAFYEHGKLEHGNSLHEEVTRVPLLLHGPGLEPGTKPLDASLVDLPRTLAGLVGIPPEPAWRGVDLLATDVNAPIPSFWHTKAHHRVSLVDGSKKLIGDAALDEVLEAYDLALDPGEHTDVRDTAPWPTEMAQRHTDFLRRILQAATAPQTLSASERSEALAELEAIGYTGS